MMGLRQDALVFRSDIRPLLKLSAVIALVGPFLFFLIISLRSHPENQGFGHESLLIVAGPGVIGILVAAIAIVSRHRSIVVVSPEGLTGYDRHGRDHFIAWSEILSVEPFEPDLGLRYLRIAVPFRAEYVTLPLFLENMPKFVEAVEKFAGRNNALVSALRGENRPR